MTLREHHARVVRRLGHKRWFAAAGRRLAPVDRRIYRMSRGRLSIVGVPAYPMLLLTTIGRRTGQERTTPLMYVRDGERYVVSSENFGQPGKPAGWPKNLLANPRAKVEVAGRAFPCLARPATDDEVSRCWPRLVEAWPAHQTYHARSGARHMFVLEPASESCTSPPRDPGSGSRPG
jgi:deazaflavin-dependent oxidoreductase (nitroreductase family)